MNRADGSGIRAEGFEGFPNGVGSKPKVPFWGWESHPTIVFLCLFKRLLECCHIMTLGLKCCALSLSCIRVSVFSSLVKAPSVFSVSNDCNTSYDQKHLPSAETCSKGGAMG